MPDKSKKPLSAENSSNQQEQLANVNPKPRAILQNRYEDLLDSLPVIIYIVEPHSPYSPIYVSPSITMLGYSQEDWHNISDLWIKILHEDDREKVLAETKLAISEGRETDFEYRIRARDGEIFWFYDRGRFAKDENGELLSWEGVLLDITKRKKAEQALIESETKYRALIEQASDAIILFDQDDNLLEINSKAFEMTGHKVDELHRIKVTDLVHPEDFEQVPYRREQLLKGESVISERRILHKNGTLINAEISAKKISDGRIIAIIRDITQRREMKETLRLLKSSIYQTKDSIIITDSKLNPPGPRIVFVNPAMCQMTGYSEDDLLGETPRIFQGPKTDRDVLKRLREALLRGEEFRGEAINYRKDGTEYWVEWNITPIRDDTEEITHFVAVQQNIDSRRLHDEQTRQSQKMEAIGRLAGGVAHDFNNVLTVITGYSDLTIRRLKPGDPLRHNVEEIKRAGERAAALTQQLLAFSRNQILKPRILSLSSILAEMENMLRRLIGEDVKLVIDTSSTLGNVRADSSQLEQVIMNLIVNARDAMPKGGNLTISTQNVSLDKKYAAQHINVTAGDYVRLQISDSGTGMTPETQARLFEPFFTTKEKGTGLGLATAYGIVTQSQGHITVESSPGNGATFNIYLPLIDETAENQTAQDDSSLRFGNETILLVEDEDIVRGITRRILVLCGYNVLEASNGEEALLISDDFNDRIDLMITDVVMPQMSGRELAEKLSQKRPDTRVLYISGYTDDAILHHGISHSDTYFLQKPYTPDALAQKIREILERK